jgi:FAD synthetase
MMALDCQAIAKGVYDLAESQEMIAPLVKEALEVIDQALDTHG